MNIKKRVNSENFFHLLTESLDQGSDHARGKLALNSESLILPSDPPQFSKSKIKKIREQLLKVSQPVFASILGCTPSAVKAWERGDNTPNGPAKRLLQLIEKDPVYFLQMISSKRAS